MPSVIRAQASKPDGGLLQSRLGCPPPTPSRSNVTEDI